MAEPISEAQREQAAEYVLGTLTGEARAAFKRALADDAALRGEVTAWEARLHGLNATTAEVQPPQRVWFAIEERLAPPPAEAAGRRGWWQSLTLWRSLSAAALFALAAVVALPLLRAPVSPPPVYNLVMRDAAGPQWVIACDWRSREFTATRVAASRPGAGQAHELWLVPAGEGAVPLSLGLLEGDSLHGALPATASWRTTHAFAISLEPAGGSPTGTPTGPVLNLAETPTRT